jgi:vancomycin resistance protein YoaR
VRDTHWPPEKDADTGFAGDLPEPDSTRTLPALPPKRFRRRIGTAFLIMGAGAALFVVLYLADLLVSVGDVPRGVTVAGVEVGGLSKAEAEVRLRDELGPRLRQPVPIRAGDVNATLDPRGAGLDIDWQATLDRAGSQPLDPLVRVLSFFRTREVPVVPAIDERALRDSLRRLADEVIDREMTEGGIGFRKLGDGRVEPVAIEPRTGRRLGDLDAAVAAVRRGWPAREPLRLAVSVTRPRTTSRGVQATLRHTVAPLVGGPVTVRGDGGTAVLRPSDISSALRFAPGGHGRLRVTLERSLLQRVLWPVLERTERPARDARMVFKGDKPTIEPSQAGRRIDWERTFRPFLQVADRRGKRVLPVIYRTTPAEVTTEEVEKLGIAEVVGEFTIDGVAPSVASNVRAIAAAVDGAVVRPGQTFSLDERTGPRTASQGYVTAPLHADGTGPKVVGGGVSAFTTALYNAAYLAGLEDAGHTPHSHYVAGYPPARDAISIRQDGSGVDMAFTNNTSTGVAIQNVVSESRVTVRIWGTRQYRVDSITGRRSNLTPPAIEHGGGEKCVASRGKPGFTISDTRVLSDVKTGEEIRRETSTVRYRPRPAVVC